MIGLLLPVAVSAGLLWLAGRLLGWPLWPWGCPVFLAVLLALLPGLSLRAKLDHFLRFDGSLIAARRWRLLPGGEFLRLRARWLASGLLLLGVSLLLSGQEAGPGEGLLSGEAASAASGKARSMAQRWSGRIAPESSGASEAGALHDMLMPEADGGADDPVKGGKRGLHRPSPSWRQGRQWLEVKALEIDR